MSADSYKQIMDQKADIMRSSVGIDYAKYTTEERMMSAF